MYMQQLGAVFCMFMTICSGMHARAKARGARTAGSGGRGRTPAGHGGKIEMCAAATACYGIQGGDYIICICVADSAPTAPYVYIVDGRWKERPEMERGEGT
jgi:hypothetical protein